MKIQEKKSYKVKASSDKYAEAELEKLIQEEYGSTAQYEIDAVYHSNKFYPGIDAYHWEYEVTIKYEEK
jgi:hypothetical protein